MTERLATTRLLQGDVAAAHVLADQALALWTRAATSEPIQVAMARLVRSQVAVAERDLAAARALAEQARAPLARDFGDDHLYTAAARLQLLTVALKDAPRDVPAIVGDTAAIVAAFERDLGRDTRWLCEPLTLLGEALVLADRHAEAREALARAAAIADVAGLVAARAEVDLVLARATWPTDPVRARGHAHAAAAVFRRIGALARLDEAESWLREHP
jgi:tetratricopeptide (TPR) repeat protein